MTVEESDFEKWFDGWYSIAFTLQERMTNPSLRSDNRVPAYCAYLAGRADATEGAHEKR